MTQITVVTSFSPKGFALVGREMVQTFKRFWPDTIPLVCAYEGAKPYEVEHGFDLLRTEPCRSFLAEYTDNPLANGTKQAEGRYWKRPGTPYNFRFDAIKFARKVFAIEQAAWPVRGKLFWVDADVVTNAPVTADFLHQLLPDDAQVCCLRRPKTYSECGFVGYNLDRAPVRDMIAAFSQEFASGAFFQHAEWHDSWIFDRMLERFAVTPTSLKHNDPAQPFDASILRTCMVHHKGPRKHARKASRS